MNILILISDQLRRQALGCYGDHDAITPNIDQLAADGVCFQNACSTYPVCVPFRFTLMTGETAHSRLIPAIEWAMSPTERTLADEFNAAGYETAYIGKWHLDGGHGRMGSARQCGLTPVRRSNQGRWKRWFGFELRNEPYDTYYFVDDDLRPRRIEGYQTDGLYDLGMEFIRSCPSSKPFCTVISVEPPHDPFVAPPELAAKWAEREITLPPNFSARDTEQRAKYIADRKRYYAMVENLDQNVGRLRAFLEEQGLAENTLIVFMSDHGELNGAHGLMEKQWPYEESVGIPLLVYDPRCTAGKKVKTPVCTEDLFPTILGLAGLTVPDDKPGEDLSPLVRGEMEKLSRDGVMLEFVAEHRASMVFHQEVWRAFRTERFKYTVKGDKFGGKPWQFFDLQSDPYEMNNLIEDPAWEAQITRHHRKLSEQIKISGDPFVLLPAFGVEGVNIWDVSPETQNRSESACCVARTALCRT